MRFSNVKKASGEVQKFDRNKIEGSIRKAFEASGEASEKLEEHVDILMKAMDSQLDEFPGVFRPTTSQLGSMVEDALVFFNHAKTAKQFILYRDKKTFSRETSKHIVDLTDEYLGKRSWRLKENANFSYSVGGLEFFQSGAMNAKYWLEKILPKHLADAHVNGDIHHFDLSRCSIYCSGFEMQKFLREGLKGVATNLSSKPPSHLRSLVNQLINFVGIMANELSGACAINNISTIFAPFIKKDSMTEKEVKQDVQNFVFSLCIPSRWSSQSPFSNVTIDLTIPNRLKNLPAIVGGVEQDFTYGDCEAEMKLFNKVFFQVLLEGDSEGRPFSFPIPTINIDPTFDWDDPQLDLMWEAALKYGYFYFANYINSDLTPDDARSMCCRLRLKTSTIKAKSSGLLGGTGDVNTGSVAVAGVNLARIGYLAKSKPEFKKMLIEKLELCYESLEIRRKFLKAQLDAGLYPYFKWYVGDISTYFSTVGEIGMNEALVNFMDKGIDTEEGKQFALEIMDIISIKVDEFSKRSGNMYNHEQLPGEGACVRLAQVDSSRYRDIFTQYGPYTGIGEAVYYTGSTLLPVQHTSDLYKIIEHQNDFLIKYTGGSVCHLFLGERLTDINTAKNVIKKIFTTYELPYVSLTPTYSICPTHKYISGEHFQCPTCGEDSEVYTRVVGYYRAVSAFNKGKQAEYYKRRTFEDYFK